LHCAAHRLFIVGPGAFKPVPKVESAVVRLLPHATPPLVVRDQAAFAALVARAFSQRRKTLRNTLKGVLSDAQIEAAGVDPTTRAEQLSLADFARLADRVTQ
jgi:16S rRNA (adenine1518-N6/adenine1519-N6)-dimethyltransferase